MKQVIITCDRCGKGEGERWEEKIFTLALELPLDGINGGQEEYDLCHNCRLSFWEAFNRWRTEGR